MSFMTMKPDGKQGDLKVLKSTNDLDSYTKKDKRKSKCDRDKQCSNCKRVGQECKYPDDSSTTA
ncbi:hypothetical protein E4U55_000167 [Claviceps digitariae]|nr:hypothetical protein E4U55_000167 [Claviceps digitariae]